MASRSARALRTLVALLIVVSLILPMSAPLAPAPVGAAAPATASAQQNDVTQQDDGAPIAAPILTAEEREEALLRQREAELQIKPPQPPLYPPPPAPAGLPVDPLTEATTKPRLAAGAAVVELTPAGEAQTAPFAGRPLTLRTEAGALPAAVDARLEVLDPDQADQLSPAGVAFRLDFASKDAAHPLPKPQRPLQLTLDYSQIQLPYGGSYADRLVLYRVSGCETRTVTPGAAAHLGVDAPSRPHAEREVIECAQWEALPGRNDRAAGQLTVDLTELTPAAGSALPASERAQDAPVNSEEPDADDNGVQIYLPNIAGGASDAASARTATASGGSFYVLSSGSGGQQGDYSFTPFANVSEHQVSLATGAATTGYPIPVPPAAAGPAPDVRLGYNSGSVDGMHTHKNNQPGSIGIGWSLQEGYIERHLKTCGVSQAPGDLCLTGDNYSIVLNGVSARLVHLSGSLYRLQDDPYWRVEKTSLNAHGDHPDAQNEYWIVTTPDGTGYRFGGEFKDVANPSSGDLDSVFYATVYDTDPATCGNYSYDLCDKAWRWNLDRVEDTNGNQIHYFYSQEDNYYKARNDSTSTFRKRYVRAGHVSRIEYTTRSGVSQPHARVLFHMEVRCGDPSSDTACTWPTDFPDTPGDLACEYSGTCSQNKPTFWSQRRLDSVQTQVWDTGTSAWRTVAIHDLSQSFPVMPTDGQGDSSESKLWLQSITQRPGGAFDRSAFRQIEAEAYDSQSGIQTEETTDVGRGRNVGWTDNNDYLRFARTDFGGGANELLARVASPVSGGQIEVRLGGTTGTLLGIITVPNTGGWQSWTTESVTLSPVPSGVQDLYLVFKGALNLNWFRFTPSGSLPGLPPVQYAQTTLANRVNYNVSGVSPMYMPRVMTVTTQLSGTVQFTYGQSHTYQNGSCAGYTGSMIRLPYDCFPAWDPGDPNITWDDGWVLWNKWKVTQLQKWDTFSGNQTEHAIYAYSTPTWHYGDSPALPDINSCSLCPTRHWNDFRGSEVVTVTDASGAQTEQRFFRGMDDDRLNTSGGAYDAKITLSDGVTVFDDKNWWRGKTVETQRLQSSGSARLRTVHWFKGTSTAGSGISGAYFTGVEKTEQTWYGNYDKTTRTTYTYDIYGNATLTVNEGEIYTANDERTVERSFAVNTTDWIVNKPHWEKLWEGSSPGGTLAARTDYLYDNQAAGSDPTAGNPTEVRRFHGTGASDYYTSTTGYDSWGRPVTVHDANGNPTTTAYHATYGYVTSVTNALNQTTSFETDPGWGAQTKITDPNNHVTELEYDAYGRLTAVWLPTESKSGGDEASLVYEYHPNVQPAYVRSRQLQVESSASYLDTWTYVDGFGRTIQTQQPMANGNRSLVSRQYNGMGQLLNGSSAYEDANAAGSGYALPTWSSVPNYHNYLYEEMGRLFVDYTKSGSSTPFYEYTFHDAWWHRHYDRKGGRDDRTLDAHGNVTGVIEFNGGAQYDTVYAYNARDELIQVTDDANNHTWISYNLLGWKTSMTDPDMGTWWYGYDPVGNLKTQIDARGQTIWFGYDALNRLIQKRKGSSTGALIAEYGYDSVQVGQRSWSKGYNDAGGVVERYHDAYDARGRLTSERWIAPTPGGGTFRFDYTHNEADQRTSLRYPGGNGGQPGETVNYTYSGVGELTGVSGTSTYVSSATYNAQGRPTQMSQPNVTRTWSYDSSTLRLSSITAGTTWPWTNRQNLSYNYDNNDNVTSLTDHQNQTSGISQVQSFGYDALDRLTSASTNLAGVGQYNHTYSYNSIGNLTSNAGVSQGYNDANHDHAVTHLNNVQKYWYDGNGNQVTRVVGGVTYTLVYDYENRLTEVQDSTGTIARFWYDADGNRVKGEIGANPSVITVYIGGLYEYSGGVHKKYYEGPGGIVAVRDGSSLYYLLQDHLNSTSRIVTSSGAIQDTTYYFPFGGKRGGSYSSITTQRYTGQYHEQNLPGSEGLYYYGARWYDAQVGRFLSADTLVPDPGNPQDLNRYAYVRNSPLKYNDPSGHQASCMMNQDNTWDCNGNATLGGKTHQIDSSALSPQESSTFSETPFSPNQMEKLTELAKQAAETQLVYTEDGDIDWEATMESGAGDLLGACGQIVGGLCGLSFGASVAVFAVGGTGSVDLVADSNGDIAAYGTFGGGGYAVFSGWSARGYGGALMAVSNASVDDLKSWSVQFGGSAYYGTAGTAVEWITGRNNKGEPWHGAIFSGPMNAQAGWGAEIHATFTYSRQLFRGTPRPY